MSESMDETQRQEEKPVILVTNDDGFRAPGIQALFAAMNTIGEAIMVAPEHDNSAVSHSLTMRRPLHVHKREAQIYTVDGTPTDCVIIAVGKLLARLPALVVSGINPGENIGDDISYSGTVSAAIEGTMVGIPSFAISLAGEEPGEYRDAALFSIKLAKYIFTHGLPSDTLLNVNMPACDKFTGEVRFTRQGRRLYDGALKETFDPWGRQHFWIGGGRPSMDPGGDTDAQALLAGAVSITPIHLDLTNHQALASVRQQWMKSMNGKV